MTGRRHPVHEEFAAALKSVDEGLAVALNEALARQLREWAAKEQEDEPSMRFENRSTSTYQFFSTVRALLDRSDEHIHLLLVGEPMCISGAICATQAACHILETMLDKTRTVAVCCLSTSGGFIFDVDDETGSGREFYAAAWGSMKAVLSEVAEVEGSGWHSLDQ